MAGSSLNDREWKEIKQGSLTVTPVLASALSLPYRDSSAVQCGQAMLSATLVDGQEIHLGWVHG